MNSKIIDFNNIEDLIVSSILSITITTLLFSIVFFLLTLFQKKIFTIKNVSYQKKIILNIVLGTLLSLISLVLFEIGILIGNQYFFVSQTIFFLVFALFTSTFIMIGIAPGFITINVLYFLYNNFYVNQQELIYAIIFFLFASITVFVVRFIFENKFFGCFFSILILFLIMTLLAYMVFDEQGYIIYISINVVSFFLFLILYTISYHINNLLNKTYSLKTSIQYDNDIFVNNGYSEIAFKKYIQKNNIQTGIFFTLNFLDIEKLLYKKGRASLEEVKKTFVKYIYYNFGNECFYFKTKKNKYAIFVPTPKCEINLKNSISNNFSLKRNEVDFLKKYELYLEKLPKKINIDKDDFNVRVNAICSLYGIHSNNFKTLDTYNENSYKIIKNKKQLNSIYLFNYLDNYYDKEKDEFEKISQLLKLNEIELSIDEKMFVNAFNNSHQYFFVSNIIWIEKNIYYFSEIYSQFMNHETIAYLLRYFGYQALKLFNNYLFIDTKNRSKLIIDYPLEYLDSSEFNLNNFLKKFDKFNFNQTKVVLNFNCKNFDIDKLSELAFLNLKKLNDKNVKTAITLNEKDLSILKKIFNVDYLFLEKNVSKQKLQKIKKEIKDKKCKVFVSKI